MKQFEPSELKKLYIPPSNSHKGQNGKLLLIGGSKLFHAASLWSLGIASKIVDMVYYSSVDENNQIVMEAKKEFRNGIIIPRNKIEDYVAEADCILIGPGLPRKDGEQEGDDDTKKLTERLLKKYPEKKWVIDGGSLQTMDPKLIPHKAILTPHYKEFEKLFSGVIPNSNNVMLNSFQHLPKDEILKQVQDDNNKKVQHDNDVRQMAEKYNCTIVLKGPVDIVCGKPFDSAQGEIRCTRISGGNAGMTKGGTGDVLAGLIAALYCKNDDPFLVAQAGSFFKKKAGESLSERVGYYFNSSDLVDEIPRVMKKYLL